MKKPKVEESNPADEVPAYIVTFSDMVTLLLTFFVLLLSLADVQDPELFNKGRDSLIKAASHCGLGVLMSQSTSSPQYTAMRTRYETHEDDPTADRTIDEERERLRRLFERINQSMTTIPSQIQARQPQFFSLPIAFARKQATLSARDRNTLKQFAANLLQTATPRNTTLYVLALSENGGTSRDGFILSAQRAESIATYLRTQLPTPAQWSIASWGAGTGGQWSGPDGILGTQSKALIAVLRQ